LQTWQHLCNELGEEPNANNFDPSVYTRIIDDYRKVGRSHIIRRTSHLLRLVRKGSGTLIAMAAEITA
jgi:hypothetical protein